MPTILPPTLAERIGRAVGYLFTALIGFSAVWFPREVVNGADTADVLAPTIVVWALFMASALPAATATIMGRHRIEFALIPLFTCALLAANVNAWYLTATIDSTIMARACASSALVCLLVVRWLTLNRINKPVELWTHEPSKSY